MKVMRRTLSGVHKREPTREILVTLVRRKAMRTRLFGGLAGLGVVLALVSIAAASRAATQLSPAPGAVKRELYRVALSIEGLRSGDGRVLALIFASKNGFPGEVSAAYAKAQTTEVSGGRASIVFSNLPAGTYAVAVLHDENDNGKMDTNLLGIPSEGVGASNGARPRLGPPRWSDAKFDVRADMAAVVEVRYW